jgi:hypothetical protein
LDVTTPELWRSTLPSSDVADQKPVRRAHGVAWEKCHI